MYNNFEDLNIVHSVKPCSSGDCVIPMEILENVNTVSPLEFAQSVSITKSTCSRLKQTVTIPDLYKLKENPSTISLYPDITDVYISVEHIYSSYLHLPWANELKGVLFDYYKSKMFDESIYKEHPPLRILIDRYYHLRYSVIPLLASMLTPYSFNDIYCKYIKVDSKSKSSLEKALVKRRSLIEKQLTQQALLCMYLNYLCITVELINNEPSKCLSYVEKLKAFCDSVNNELQKLCVSVIQ